MTAILWNGTLKTVGDLFRSGRSICRTGNEPLARRLMLGGKTHLSPIATKLTSPEPAKLYEKPVGETEIRLHEPPTSVIVTAGVELNAVANVQAPPLAVPA